jgi:hypothetical protein
MSLPSLDDDAVSKGTCRQSHLSDFLIAVAFNTLGKREIGELKLKGRNAMVYICCEVY